MYIRRYKPPPSYRLLFFNQIKSQIKMNLLYDDMVEENLYEQNKILYGTE